MPSQATTASCTPSASLSESFEQLENSSAPDTIRTRSRIGVLVRLGADPSAIAEARLHHADALVEKRVTDLLAAAPPLSEATRRRLAALVATVGSDAPADSETTTQ